MRDLLVRLIYAIVVLLGWGLSSFLMGLTGKQMHHSSALFYNLIGTVVVCAFFFDELEYDWNMNHFYGVVAGMLICVADWAYYKLADNGMVLLLFYEKTECFESSVVLFFSIFLNISLSSLLFPSLSTHAQTHTHRHTLTLSCLLRGLLNLIPSLITPQDVSLIGPVSSLYILVPVTLGVSVLGEPFSFRKALGIALALLAMYVLSTADAADVKRRPEEEEKEKPVKETA